MPLLLRNKDAASRDTVKRMPRAKKGNWSTSLHHSTWFIVLLEALPVSRFHTPLKLPGPESIFSFPSFFAYSLLERFSSSSQNHGTEKGLWCKVRKQVLCDSLLSTKGFFVIIPTIENVLCSLSFPSLTTIPQISTSKLANPLLQKLFCPYKTLFMEKRLWV